MQKTTCMRLIRVFLTGMGVDALVCLISSYVLRLGYYAPCFTALTEPCGGELNAAAVQALFFGAVGVLTAAVGSVLKKTLSELRPARRSRRAVPSLKYR